MSQDGKYFLDSQAERGSQDSYGSEGSNSWDYNDPFINNTHISSSHYTTSESEYSGWSSGSSNHQTHQEWAPSQATTITISSSSSSSSISTIILSDDEPYNSDWVPPSQSPAYTSTQLDGHNAWSQADGTVNSSLEDGEIPSWQP